MKLKRSISLILALVMIFGCVPINHIVKAETNETIEKSDSSIEEVTIDEAVGESAEDAVGESVEEAVDTAAEETDDKASEEAVDTAAEETDDKASEDVVDNAIEEVVPEENIVNGWKVSSPNPGTELVESVEKDGKSWTRFVAASGNDNGKNPAVFTNEELGELVDGEFTFTISPNTPPKETRAGFYLRYQSVNKAIFVGYDVGGWFWQVYNGIDNPWYGGARIPAPEIGQEQKVVINLVAGSLTVTIDGKDAFSGPVDVSSLPEAGKVAVKAGAWGTQYSDILLLNEEITVTEKIDISGRVVDANYKALEGVKVTNQFGDSTNTDVNGNYVLSGVLKTNQVILFSKEGYESQEVEYIKDGESVFDVVMQVKSQLNTDVLKNSTMEVVVNKDFPQVVEYKMINEGGKIFEGQREKLESITINSIDFVPNVSYEKLGDESAQYILENLEGDLKFRLTYRLTLSDNTLELKLVKVENLNDPIETNADIVRTIEITNHNLVSINSKQENPNFMGGNVNVNTRTKAGDDYFNLTDQTRDRINGYTMAVISNKDLSASIYSNTETNVLGDWKNTVATISTVDGVKVLGLSSAEFVYQKGLAYKPAVEEELNALPTVKVSITGDANGDGQINWNDGAIAHRNISRKRDGAELIPETVATRIAMNFGSQAQNPFLVTLDNVKKVSLHTDGLGQNVLLKGYGSEGHDSGHLNYADIGRRIGGAKDMKILLDEGEKYGAIFGIHVNASETYPESKYFSEEILRKSTDGSNYSYGWNWIDQGINIDADYDLRHGREQRFVDLAKELDRGDGSNGLDYIYVDVWGNGQSGDNGTWASQQLSKEIRKQGWAVGGEWGYANQYSSIFQHWAADLTYGGYKLKGVNSKLIRFVENHQRDSWVANYPAYSGAAMNPLLGGYNMKDFEGWQGRNSYSSYMTNLFRNNLSSKFIQHFEVNKWVDGNATDLPEALAWIPEMEVGGINKELGKSINIVRGANDYQADPDGYRTRIMTLDGKTIFHENAFDVMYLIPWYWDQNGKLLDESNQKLYHFNSNDGTSTWELPSEFAGLSNIVIYELTDTGKQNKQVLAVSDNKVTIEAKANTAYVLYKGEKENPSVTWSEYAHIVDSGFNSRNLNAWTVIGDENATLGIVDTATGTQVLKIADNQNETRLSQKLTDLKAGQRYAVYVGVENRSDSKAFIELKDKNANVIDYNFTDKSIALNFVKAYAHNTNNQSYTVEEINPLGYKGTSYFQNMYVFFTAPEDGSDIYLTIGKEAGQGTSYFDDIRVFENEMNNYPDGDKVFVQDFENSPQGLFPFVNGGSEYVEDNRIHLSEKHEPYTQRGWHEKKVSDVIEGTWSLKVNGLTGKDHLLYQTIPQNYRFIPGKTYKVSLDYLVGSNGTYQFVLGDGKYYDNYNSFIATYDLEETVTNPEGEEANKLLVEFTVPADSDGNYWIGMFSTSNAADTRDANNVDVNFAGYRDLIIDNLVIEEKDAKDTLNTDELIQTIEKAKAEIERNIYTNESAAKLQSQIDKAEWMLNNPLTIQKHLDQQNAVLLDLIDALEIFVADKSALQENISIADAIKASDKYSQEAKSLIDEALAHAKEINVKDNASQEEVNLANKELEAAIFKARELEGFVEVYKEEAPLDASMIEAIATTGDAPYDGGATKEKIVDGDNTFISF